MDEILPAKQLAEDGEELTRTSITIAPDVREMAKAPMRRRFVRNFSDYVTRLIVEDAERATKPAVEVAL